MRRSNYLRAKPYRPNIFYIITYNHDAKLIDFYKVTVTDVQKLHILIGYLRTSEFKLVADAIVSTENNRINVGLNIANQTYLDIEEARSRHTHFTPSEEAHTAFVDSLANETANSDGSFENEQSIKTIFDLHLSSKLEIRA